MVEMCVLHDGNDTDNSTVAERDNSCPGCVLAFLTSVTFVVCTAFGPVCLL